MIVTYRDVQNVTFPVFKITGSNWSYSDGLLFLDDQLLDDKNMPGQTLGIRRLQTPFKNLFPLRNALISHIGIIKQTGKNFIDSNGDPFIYDKTLMCKLKFAHQGFVVDKGIAVRVNKIFSRLFYYANVADKGVSQRKQILEGSLKSANTQSLPRHILIVE